MPESLSPRERVRLTLDHREPDRVPITLGGSANHLAEQRYHVLREHFRLPEPARRTLVGFYTTPDYAPLLDCLGTDFRFIHLRPPASYQANSLLADFAPFTDEWGLTHRLVGGYYDLGGTPLCQTLDDLTVQKIEAYPWPDPYDPTRVAGLKEEIEHLYGHTDYALVAHRPVYGNMWEMSRWLLGMENALMLTRLGPTLFDALLTKLCDVLDGFYDAFLDIVGPYVQVVEMAEDLGTNTGPMLNPKFYRQYMQPKHKRTIELIKRKAPNAKVMLHCDGAIRRFIPDLIEAGFDILNPIEAHLPGMEPAGLKQDFGRDLVFQGAVDVKEVLTKGSRAAIHQHVRQQIEQLGQGGGYILAPAHNFGNDIPLENMLAFFEAGHTLGFYPLEATQ
jgi:uroporphyrinogen decarboxylase